MATSTGEVSRSDVRQRRSFRSLFTLVIVPDCPGDRMHRFLLLPASALLALAMGCGSGGDAAAPGDGVPAGEVPDELVGRWRFEQILDQTCDPDTGLCVPTSAQTETLTLTSQGRFEHVLYAESNFPPCNMVVQHQSEGSADV